MTEIAGPTIADHAARAKVRSAALHKRVGARLREARELCGMSQLSAARKLGYANSSKLSRIEQAMDQSSAPLRVVAEAARLYQVSTDYLLGLTDDWDPLGNPATFRQTAAWMFDSWERLRERDLHVLYKLQRHVDLMAQAVLEMLEASAKIDTAFARFCELNPEFDEMRAGATLKRSVEDAVSAIARTDSSLRWYRIQCSKVSQAARSNEVQMAMPFADPPTRSGAAA